MDAAAFTHQGARLLQLGDTPGAIVAFDEAIRLDPRCSRALANRGRALHRQGKGRAALADLDEAIRLDPNQSSWLGWRAIVHMAGWEFDRALRDVDAALTLAPGTWELHLLRGHARYHLRDADAESDYQAAFELDPAALAKRIVDEIAAETLRNAAAALKNCEHHLRADPMEFHSLCRRGLIRLLQWQDDEAEADFAKCRECHPVGAVRLARYIEEAKRKRAMNTGTGSIYSHQ